MTGGILAYHDAFGLVFVASESVMADRALAERSAFSVVVDVSHHLD
jgi:hypothetical protein